MRIRMFRIEELHDVEAAFVDVEMDVARLEIRRMCLPDNGLRILRLNHFPYGSADARTVAFRIDEQQIQ